MVLKLLTAGLLLFAHAYSYAECEYGDVFIEEYGVCFSFEFKDGPNINQRGNREFSHGVATLYPSDKISLQKDPHFYLWMKMPAHEHGAGPVSVEQIDEGRYKINKMLLREMPGQWFLRVILDSELSEFSGEIAITEWMD